MLISRDERLNHTDFRDKYGLFALIFLDAESKVCLKYEVLYGKNGRGQKGRWT
ncbi:protein of unknown function [Candidatus Nitrotoga arctica]|uniref:Uncharacterized protein n=1 Tax=Candidatus Nitrotoga arctica TaxID=453162 RepID=A0ABM8Z1Q7_9PROT|nr:protein of unknown function [Candidatus Nitrotoga arctica]